MSRKSLLKEPRELFRKRKQWVAQVLSVSVRKPGLVLILSLPILFLGIWLASGLRMQSKMDDMLPRDSASMKAQEVFEEGFDAQDTALLVVRGEAERCRAFLEEANRRIHADELAYRTLFRIPVSVLAPWAFLYAEQDMIDEAIALLEKPEPRLLAQSLQAATSISAKEDEWMVSDNGNTYLMMIQPRLDPDYYAESAQSFLSGMEHILSDLQLEPEFMDLEAGLTGGAFIQDVEGDRRAMGSLMSSALLTLVLVVLFVIWAFRRLLLPVSMMYPLLFGVIWTSAFAAITLGSLNTFSIGFAALLFGLGIDFSVHMLNRYLEERQACLNTEEALRHAMRHASPGIVMGALTTSLSFFAFLLARFKAFSQIGILSGTGILILCAVMLVLVPALIGSIVKKTDPHRPVRTWNWLGLVGRFSFRRRGWIRLMVMICLLLLLPNAVQMRLDRNVSQIYPDDLNSLHWMEVVEQEFGWSTNTLTFPVDDLESLRQVVSTLSLREDVQEVRSILSFLPENEMERREELLAIRSKLAGLGIIGLGKAEEDRVPEERKPGEIHPVSEVGNAGAIGLVEERQRENPGLSSDRVNTRLSSDRLNPGFNSKSENGLNAVVSLLDPPPLRLEDLPEEIYDMYVGRNGMLLAELIPRVSLWDPTSYAKLEEAIFQSSGHAPVGMPAIMNDVARLVERDIPLITLVCLLLALGMLLLLFRQGKAALVALLPVVLAVWVVLGLMPVFGIPLNLFTIMGFPLIIGIGLDNGIHLTHRLLFDRQEESKRMLDAAAHAMEGDVAAHAMEGDVAAHAMEGDVAAHAMEGDASDGVAKGVIHTGKALVITTVTTVIAFGSLVTIDHPGMQGLGATVSLGLCASLAGTLLLIPGLLGQKR